MKYKWILFDLDGTLIDSLPDITEAINYALHKYGFNSAYTTSDIKKYIGHGSKELVKGAFLNYSDDLDLFIKVHDTYNEYYHAHNNCLTKEFLHVTDTLLALKEQGVKLGVLSNKPDFDTKAIVKHYFPNIFEYVVGAIDGVNLKPDKMVLDIFSTKYDLNKEDILYVGDMATDMFLAKNFNCDFLLLTYGYGKLAELNDFTYKINDFKEILEII